MSSLLFRRQQGLRFSIGSFRTQRSKPMISYLFEDEQIIVVNKPHNVLSVPGKRDAVGIPFRRMDQWRNSALMASETPEAKDNIIGDVLTRVAASQAIPRKKEQFCYFLKKSLKVLDPLMQENVWNLLEKTDFELCKRNVVDQVLSDEEKSAADLIEMKIGQRVFHVHRLDMETSGVLLFARTRSACNELSRQFREREVTKVYRALVANHIPSDIAREINVPICPDLTNRPYQAVDFTFGKSSRTIISNISHEMLPAIDNSPIVASGDDSKLLVNSAGEEKAGRPVTRVDLEPLTGRTHQLRVHMAHIGHPIVGDTLYATPEVQAACPRLCLHAQSLTIRHPESGEMMTFEANACDF